MAVEMILAVRPAMRHCSAVVLVDGEQPFVMNGGWSHDIGWLVMHQKPLPAKALGYSDMERSMFAVSAPAGVVRWQRCVTWRVCLCGGCRKWTRSRRGRITSCSRPPSP